MGFEQLMKLPYPIFLSFLKENRLMDLRESEDGREYLAKIDRLNVTTPDFSKLSKLSGFKKAGEN
ncbi:hypothetical protein [Neobacillus sp. PS3-40]|uniref:hypothetical protein n=1 Tax=Neobacillus sp. PS3-40 TaxID=3070679 RepID=UPI0027DFA504|nr:hypothetical protein [Neobacillus sp. PS3-40]WML44091.1 hypothetical protein RCG20_20295 [Neobacillus sp. PS3-40]